MTIYQYFKRRFPFAYVAKTESIADEDLEEREVEEEELCVEGDSDVKMSVIP